MRNTFVAAAARCLRGALIGVAIVAAALGVARAQDAELPGRVGRVALFAGDVYASAQDRADAWTAVGLNQPVTTGDNLWVSAGGRAEIDYGGGQFRLGDDTNVNVAELDDRTLGLFVAQGRLIVRVRVLDPGDAAYVDTPNTHVELTQPGLYRVDVDPSAQTTTLVVRDGEATFALSNGVQQALPGYVATIAGPDPMDADIATASGVDGFDGWSAARDRHYERARSASYVSSQMIGYADLDAYGAWEPSPTYGPVWYPSVAVADWAPYRFGHWTWVRGYGYAWVDDAPWGYAPFHYGRWVYVGGRWGWCPGDYVARPIWAPALVAWYGGVGWSVSATYGAPVYGWVPLAWGEPYVPWWRGCSRGCWERYNRPYAVNVVEQSRRPLSTYANMRVPGAVTAVPGTALAGSRPVAASRVPIQLASSAPMLNAAPPIKPLPVAQRAVQPGQRGAPMPASALYQGAASRSITSSPPSTSRRNPSPFGSPQTTPVPPSAPPNAAESRRAVEPRARTATPPASVVQPATPVPRVATPQPTPQPAPGGSLRATEPRAVQPRAIEPKPHEAPRTIAVPQPAPVPAASAGTRAAPAASPAPRAVVPGGAPVVPVAPPTPRAPATPNANAQAAGHEHPAANPRAVEPDKR